MIVSSREISRVLDFNSRPFREREIAVLTHPLFSRPPAAGQDPDWRTARVRDLRCLLSSGVYAIPPADVAEKMIGRALCDQVSRMYDP